MSKRIEIIVCPHCKEGFTEIVDTTPVEHQKTYLLVTYGELELETGRIRIFEEDKCYKHSSLTQIIFTCPNCGEVTKVDSLEDLVVVVKNGQVSHKGKQVPEEAVKRILAQLV